MNVRNQGTQQTKTNTNNGENPPGIPNLLGMPGNPNEMLKQMGFQLPAPIVMKEYTQKHLEAFMYF